MQNIIDSTLKSNINKDALDLIAKTLWQHPHNSGIQSTIEILKIEKSLLESQLNKSILNQLNLTNNAIANLKSRESNSKYRKSNLDSLDLELSKDTK